MGGAVVLHRIAGRFRFCSRRIVAVGLIATLVSFGVQGRAGADTSAYELYCPGAPVGNIAFNGVLTTGSLSPSSPTKGQSFSITNYQTTFTVPTAIVNALAALGDTTFSGDIVSTVEVAGAKPAKRIEKETYSSPIPTTVNNPLPVSAPSSPVGIGPFKVTGSSVAVTVNAHVTMATSVTPGKPGLKVRCLTYPNNTTSSGLGAKKPPGNPVAPVIAMSG